jgi:signal transduction histidine kinase
MAVPLLLTAITGAAALTAFARIHTDESALLARTRENEGRLEQVRAAIYLSAADPQPLAALVTLRDKTLRQVAAPETASLRGDVVAWFRQQIAQRRGAMLGLSNSIAAALDRAWQSGPPQLDALYARFRWMLAAELVLVVALGAVVSTLTVRRTVRLEAQPRALSAQLLQAQEEERRAIARELHDEVGQSLSGALLENAPAALRTRLEDVVDSIRRIALSLRPSMLDDLGLVAALEMAGAGAR